MPEPTNPEPRLVGFRAVYVFDRLSRDLWPSLCALDVCRESHFGSPSIAASTSSGLAIGVQAEKQSTYIIGFFLESYYIF